MAAKTFDINFRGYWRESDVAGIPSESGVYCVYECTYNKNNDTVGIHKLIYIGESNNVNGRIANHEKWEDWRKEVAKANEICISFGQVDSTYRERVEAALIYHHQPAVNTECMEGFNYDRTTINTSDCNAKLSANFTVERT
ncbi:hypothetical protein Ccar_16275 [Clostridium carboxidivorans P7]|uniref:GIY-YIG nuclease family protein n=1 Tax=Clostridium carboxidivorans TaxID=217159 RepID=UPI00064EBD6A|nr:GIY-YIG nuclease family protein [Clostridium carboxidivorans]AKN32334.1 hypothetical protein Ccar_16275 [Clostridium carboxidivorans P7]